MAESTDTLVFKLVIDGKEAQATLNTTTGQFVELGDTVIHSDETIKKAYQDLISESFKYQQVTEANVTKLTEYIGSQNISVDIIEKTIMKLENESKTLAVNSTAWKQKITAAANLRASMGNLITQQTGLNDLTKNSIPGTNQMRMAMSQFGYALNDAQVFMVNFRMGLMGISNNIPMIVQNFIQAKAAAGGTASTMQLITQSIMGGGGLIIGINALMLVMNLLPSLFDDTTESMEEQKNKIKELRDEYSKLTEEQLKNYILAREEELRKLEAKHPETTQVGSTSGMIGGLGPGQVTTRTITLKGEERFREDFKRVQTLQTEITALKEVRRDLGIVENIRNRIAINQEQLNKLNENEESPFFWKNIVKTANSYEEAKKTLEQWIAADEKLIKSRESGDKRDKAFEKAAKELEAAQNHQLRMAEIEGKGDAVLLAMKKEQLIKQIELYEQYKQDVTSLLNELVETELAIQKAIELPPIELDNEITEIFLDDILAVEEYEKGLIKNSLDAWYDAEEQKIRAYENYTDLKFALDREYSRRKLALDRQTLIRSVEILSGALYTLRSIIAQHTAAYKVLAVAQAIMDTYKAANVALASAPPPFNFIAMAAVIAAGLANVGKIVAVNLENPEEGGGRKPGGFAKGGRLAKGKAGIIEGTHNELIAPEEDFKTIFRTYSGELVKSALLDARNYFTLYQSSNIDIHSFNENMIRLNKHLEDGIKAYSVYDKRFAKAIYLDGSKQIRKGKI